MTSVIGVLVGPVFIKLSVDVRCLLEGGYLWYSAASKGLYLIDSTPMDLCFLPKSWTGTGSADIMGGKVILHLSLLT